MSERSTAVTDWKASPKPLRIINVSVVCDVYVYVHTDQGEVRLRSFLTFFFVLLSKILLAVLIITILCKSAFILYPL